MGVPCGKAASVFRLISDAIMSDIEKKYIFENAVNFATF
jgi:hypothetical protein